ncbi:MAG: hypothetical protein HY070_13785 [Chloroflexi bacterium]|nr:hypothetical protein [Chloroflexota bacterium]
MSKHSPYPYLRASCRVHGHEFDVLGFVDTGYDGGLVIPKSQRIGLPKSMSIIPIQLGDGTRTSAEEFVGTLVVEDMQLEVTVLFLGNEYLIGREVVDQFRLCFHRGEYLEIEE